MGKALAMVLWAGSNIGGNNDSGREGWLGKGSWTCKGMVVGLACIGAKAALRIRDVGQTEVAVALGAGTDPVRSKDCIEEPEVEQAEPWVAAEGEGEEATVAPSRDVQLLRAGKRRCLV